MNQRRVVLTLVASVIGVVIVLFMTSTLGPGISPDSAAYLYAAKSLAVGEGFVQYDEEPFVWWPPLYPSILSLFVLLGIDPLVGGRYLNAVSFGLIIFLGARMMWSLKRDWLFVIGLAAIVLAPPLVRVSTMLWSEPLFIILAILFVTRLACLVENQQASFPVLILLAGLACLQRLMGLSCVLTGFIVIMLYLKEENFSHRWLKACAFAIISCLPLALWALRNYSVSGTWMGVRGSAAASYVDNLILVVEAVASFIIPFETLAAQFTTFPIAGVYFWFEGLIKLSVGIGIGALTYALIRDRLKDGMSNSILVPLLWFVLCYTVALLVATSGVFLYDPIGERFLSPIYVFLVVPLMMWCDKTMALNKSPIRWALVSCLLIVLVLQGGRLGYRVKKTTEEGAGRYQTLAWKNSLTINELKSNNLLGEGCFLSNDAAAIYVHTGKTAKWVPTEGLQGSYIERSCSNKPCFLVWFFDKDHQGKGPKIENDVTTSEMYRTTDGLILRLAPLKH